MRERETLIALATVSIRADMISGHEIIELIQAFGHNDLLNDVLNDRLPAGSVSEAPGNEKQEKRCKHCAKQFYGQSYYIYCSGECARASTTNLELGLAEITWERLFLIRELRVSRFENDFAHEWLLIGIEDTGEFLICQEREIGRLISDSIAAWVFGKRNDPVEPGLLRALLFETGRGWKLTQVEMNPSWTDLAIRRTWLRAYPDRCPICLKHWKRLLVKNRMGLFFCPFQRYHYDTPVGIWEDNPWANKLAEALRGSTDTWDYTCGACNNHEKNIRGRDPDRWPLGISPAELRQIMLEEMLPP